MIPEPVLAFLLDVIIYVVAPSAVASLAAVVLIADAESYVRDMRRKTMLRRNVPLPKDGRRAPLAERPHASFDSRTISVTERRSAPVTGYRFRCACGRPRQVDVTTHGDVMRTLICVGCGAIGTMPLRETTEERA